MRYLFALGLTFFWLGIIAERLIGFAPSVWLLIVPGAYLMLCDVIIQFNRHAHKSDDTETYYRDHKG